MANNHLEFVTLLSQYRRALSIYIDEREDLAKQQQAVDDATKNMNEKHNALVAAMKARGIQSIRENSWDGDYFHLNDNGTLERREVETAERLDKAIEQIPVIGQVKS